MMNKLKVMIISVIICFVLFGCQNINQTSEEFSVHGKVIDNNANGVNDVKIELSYYFEFIELTKENSRIPNPKLNILNKHNNSYRPITPIQFTIYEYAHVVVWIERKCNQDSILTIVDDYWNTGSHHVFWNGENYDGLNVTNGVYIAHLETEGYSDAVEFVILRDYDGFSYDEIEYDAITDNNGYFDIQQECMPLDYEMIFYDEDNEPSAILNIFRIVKFWAIPESLSSTFVDSVYIYPEVGAEVIMQIN